MMIKLEDLEFINETKQMATRPAVAKFHANLIAKELSGIKKPIIIDLTAGSGVDSLTIAKVFLKNNSEAEIFAFENDPIRFETLKRNKENLELENLTVLNCDCFEGVEKIEKKVERIDFIYADPARRNSFKRTLNFDEFSPTVKEIIALHKKLKEEPKLMIKLPPAVDRENANLFVAHKRDVVEALKCSFYEEGELGALIVDDLGEISYAI